MNYLLLYEAFKSKGISNTIKYIKDKVGKSSSDKFLGGLKDILDSFKFPISEITDDDIQYVTAKKAKSIQYDDGDEIMNPNGILAIKFWFSLELGYLGYTGVGKHNLFDKNSFNREEIDLIKTELGLEKGELIPLNTLRGLKDGDIVVGYFSPIDDINNFSKATIIEENGIYFAIQDVASGGEPNNRGWRKYGRYSWNLGEEDNIGDDNYKLHLYKESDKDIESNIIKLKDAHIDGGKLSNANYDNYSISDLSEIKKADFALVLYVDSLVNYEDVGDIRGFRKNAKKGATALMTDEQIKKINYTNYITKLIKDLGYTEKISYENINNLQKMFSRILGNWSLFNIINGDHYNDIINSINNRTMDIINSINKEEKLNLFYESYIEWIKKFKSIENNFNKSKKIVEEKGNENTIIYMNKFYDLNNYLSKKIANHEINNLEDLRIFHFKLRSLRELLRSDYTELGYFFRVIDNFKYADYDTFGYVERANALNDDQLNEVQKGIDLIKRFIDKTF
jgi:hypothetical protein